MEEQIFNPQLPVDGAHLRIGHPAFEKPKPIAMAARDAGADADVSLVING
jgi:hypothetical protein